MSKNNAQQLLEKYQNGTCTPEEKAWVESWYLDLTAKSEIRDRHLNYQAKEAEIWAKLQNKAVGGAKVHRLWPRIAAVAAVFFALLISGIYFISYRNDKKANFLVQKIDLKPGGNNAVLTLANGSKIVLNKTGNGEISKQGNVVVRKTADGRLVYQNDDAVQGAENLMYNTMTTPRGGKYTLRLSDGSIATLDANSSITYPVSFIGNERKVTVTGQVYFEVIHNAAIPFRVTVKGQTIEDLGTHFNINAYDDEPSLKVTLVEGSVKISNSLHQTLLKPGQQSIIAPGSSVISIKAVDTDEATAWKNDLFSFNDADIKTVMRQISRWYDVDIAYEGDISQSTFTGEMHRNLNVSKVLDALAFLKVRFAVEKTATGNKIIVKH